MSDTVEMRNQQLSGSCSKSSVTTRILIVDDDANVRFGLRRRLSRCGYTVALAEDGHDGLEKAHQFCPDIILSDLMMPGVDGQELCNRIKSNPKFRRTFFILLTIKDQNEDKVGGLDAGADGYLVKPYEPDELTARLRAAERVLCLQRELDEKNQALQNALERINNELESTSAIQLSLLPQCLPQIPGYAFAAHYRPATQCSGDYYDLLPMSGGRFGMMIADVSGHGTPAMVAMAILRSLFHLLAPESETPADLLTAINRSLDAFLPTSQFITAFYAICNALSGEMLYSSAGHNPPLLLRRRNGSACFLENCRDFPLKLLPDTQYENYRMQVQPGDAVLLYTDGITEGHNEKRERFGAERLLQSALAEMDNPPQAMLQGILHHLTAFTQGTLLGDDITMLIAAQI